MLQLAVAHLQQLGLQRYEISAFARPGLQSRHNTGYWLGRPFLGLGPSAFSYWGKKRFSNSARFNAYLQALEKNAFPVDFEESLPYPRNLQELLAVQLRLLEGVNLDAFQSKHGQLPKGTHDTLEALTSRGWLLRSQDHYRLSEEGMLFYDSAAAELID